MADNMRTIKFRAWNDLERKMTKDFQDDRAYLNENGELVHWAQHSLMQFTGLLDKNGKEIYEGDLLRYEDEGNIMGSGVYTVQWDEEDAGWGLDGSATCAGQVMRLSEVIGNVYETPELEE